MDTFSFNCRVSFNEYLHAWNFMPLYISFSYFTRHFFAFKNVISLARHSAKHTRARAHARAHTRHSVQNHQEMRRGNLWNFKRPTAVAFTVKLLLAVTRVYLRAALIALLCVVVIAGSSDFFRGFSCYSRVKTCAGLLFFSSLHRDTRIRGGGEGRRGEGRAGEEGEGTEEWQRYYNFTARTVFTAVLIVSKKKKTNRKRKPEIPAVQKLRNAFSTNIKKILRKIHFDSRQSIKSRTFGKAIE